jgi:ABC-type branched-subunit amino acid transport system substrate-binding protein
MRSNRSLGGRRTSRRAFLHQAAAAGVGLGALSSGFGRAWAKDEPPIGTWPAGSSGPSVFIGITVPRTGTYAVQGEDELKGYQLAVEHINSGHPLIKAISPKTTKGVLGKEVKYGVADSEAKPNTAVQAQSRFITENKAVLLTGSTSSAVAVALNKLAQREKVLYAAGISGSNDTTGKDCVRYGVRQCFYGQTAAAAIGPLLVKTFGQNKKAAYLTPDYTYGHTVTKSMQDFLKTAGWTTVTNQVAPLGAPDYSSYLLNVANSGADVLLNVNWGHDAVLSTKQAKQFGIFDKMKLVVPYQTPFLAREVGENLMAGVYAATDFWWTLQDKYPLAKMFVEAFDKKYGYKPEWGANNAYMEFALWADAVERAGTFYPPAVIKVYEDGHKIQSTVGEVYFRAADHQLVRPVVIVRGKKAADMKNKEDFYDVVEVVPGEPLMQKPDAFGCKLGDYT